MHRLSNRFHRLGMSLLYDLEERGVKARDLRNHIAIIPCHLIQETCTSTSMMIDTLENFKTLTGLIHFLNSRIWNFIDYHLLEYTIARFGSDSLQRYMQEYVRELEKFENETTVFDFMECWPGRETKPPNYDEIGAKIDKDPKRCTIKELNDFRCSLGVEFLPSLVEYTKYIMFHYKHANGCFSVTWILPSAVASLLKEAASKPSASLFFQRNEILSFSVRGKEVYQSREMNPPGTF